MSATRRPAIAPGVEVAAAAQLACLLEASAPKPGNVSPGRHFEDARYEDFLASAAAIGTAIAAAGDRPLGATVKAAVEATREWTRSNTNLGIVLVLAPLARAALVDSAATFPAPAAGATQGRVPPRVVHAAERLQQRVRQVLQSTSVDDARDVYAAIRLASPGGLGRVETQDVAEEPTAPLLEIMRLAADRDAIAREYAHGFDRTFSVGEPALARARRDGLDWDAAVLETFLTLLAAAPDTHITRRAGADVAIQVTARAAAALDAGGVRTAAGRHRIAEMDRVLRDERHLGNPGTTADLTVAAIFVALLGGIWHRPPEARPPTDKEHGDAAAR